MSFISDAEIQKRKETKAIQEKIQTKKLNMMITEKANEKPVFEMNTNELFQIDKDMRRQQKHTEQPKINVEDIKQQLKLQDLMEERKKEVVEELLKDEEMMEIKQEVIGVLALPHTNPDKREIFHKLLNRSKTVHTFVEDNVMLRLFNKVNSNAKFATVYGLKYLQTNTVYNLLKNGQVVVNQPRQTVQEAVQELTASQPENLTTEPPAEL